MCLIPDEELIKISIRDNGEKLVDVREKCLKIIIRLGEYIKKEGNDFCQDACLVREDVARRIDLAQEKLPAGYRLMLRCGHRALSIQKKRYTWMYDKLKKQHPEWNAKILRRETSKHIAPPDIIPPHSTGGAVDISIINPMGKQLDMGTKLGRFNDKTYTDSIKITSEQRKNRELLISIMSKAGFINYPTEWWHWSYGDRYWAAALNKKYSIYKGL